MMAGRQTYDSITVKKNNRRGGAVIAVIILAILAVVIYGINIKYRPPEHEAHATSGKPEVDESFLYRTIESDFGYSFAMAANLYRQEDGSVRIFLTNPSENDFYLMCEVYDMDTAELYYKSGLLSPGEYVDSLKPEGDFENVFHNISVKVYALDMEDYTSEGTTELNLALQPW